MAGLTKSAAQAQAKAEGLKLTTTVGKNRVAELMADTNTTPPTLIDLRKNRQLVETNFVKRHRFNWGSIPQDGLLAVVQGMAREGLNPRDAEDWNASEFRSHYGRSSGTSEQKLDSLMKQFTA